MNITNNGLASYDVTFQLFDVVDSLYPANGDSLTLEEAEDYRNILRQSRFTGYIMRTVEKKGILKKNIKLYLYEKTGSSQKEVLRRLDILYSNGHNPSARFTFQPVD